MRLARLWRSGCQTASSGSSPSWCPEGRRRRKQLFHKPGPPDRREIYDRREKCQEIKSADCFSALASVVHFPAASAILLQVIYIVQYCALSLSRARARARTTCPLKARWRRRDLRRPTPRRSPRIIATPRAILTRCHGARRNPGRHRRSCASSARRTAPCLFRISLEWTWPWFCHTGGNVPSRNRVFYN